MSSSTPAVPDAAPRAPRSARHLFCSVVLALEAFVVFFAALAAFGLRAVDGGVLLAVGAVGAVLCIAAAGLLRSIAGYVLGSLVQVGLLAVGFVVPEIRAHMLAVAITFTVIWIVSLVIGSRIDVERAERHELELAHWREQVGAPEPSPGRG